MEIVWIVVIFIVIIAMYYTFKTPYSSFGENKLHFNQLVPDSRAVFFKECFGITEVDCHAFRFDGNTFWLRKQIHYKHVNSIICEFTKDVIVHKSSLPHYARWTYEKVNGGPDRRYKNNTKTMTSRQYTMRFLGIKNRRMYLYDLPYRDNPEIEKAIDRFNKMLSLNNTIDLEQYWQQYNQAFQKLIELQESRTAFTERQSAATNVVQAFSSLPYHLISTNFDLVTKHGKAQEELALTQKLLTEIDSQISELSNKMQAVTNQIRQQLRRSESIEIIRAYH